MSDVLSYLPHTLMLLNHQLSAPFISRTAHYFPGVVPTDFQLVRNSRAIYPSALRKRWRDWHPPLPGTAKSNPATFIRRRLDSELPNRFAATDLWASHNSNILSLPAVFQACSLFISFVSILIVFLLLLKL